MGRAPAFYFLITLLTYFLILSSAIPISRLQRMPLQGTGDMPSVRGNAIESEVARLHGLASIGTKRSVPEDESTINARMAVEMQDYQPSGPNGKHKPPGWR